MLTDYVYFGDVVDLIQLLEQTRRVGLSIILEKLVFGSVLMNDEKFESFKWLFETFLKAHNGKQPKTIYTDQDAPMRKAIKVFLET
jgi:zinc finger SWIM domain-containing protein 3